MLSLAANNTMPPFSDGTNNSNVRYFASTTTHTTSAIPSTWRGKNVVLQAETSDVYVLLGSVSTLEVDRSATSAGPTLGWLIPAGDRITVFVPRAATHISVESGVAAVLRAWESN